MVVSGLSFSHDWWHTDYSLSKKGHTWTGVLLFTMITNAKLSAARALGALALLLRFNASVGLQSCSVADFGFWSDCTKACGTGSQQRTRATVEPTFGGKACPHSTETRGCNTHACAAVQCDPGKYAAGDSTRCDACAAGRFFDLSHTGGFDASACKPCGGGTYQPSEGQTTCNPCAPGKLCVEGEERDCLDSEGKQAVCALGRLVGSCPVNLVCAGGDARTMLRTTGNPSSTPVSSLPLGLGLGLGLPAAAAIVALFRMRSGAAGGASTQDNTAVAVVAVAPKIEGTPNTNVYGAYGPGTPPPPPPLPPQLSEDGKPCPCAANILVATTTHSERRV